jgi:hypothetical protein
MQPSQIPKEDLSVRRSLTRIRTHPEVFLTSRSVKKQKTEAPYRCLPRLAPRVQSP